MAQLSPASWDSQSIFDAGLAQLDVRGLVKLTHFMSYSALPTLNMDVFGVALPQESREAPPPI